MNGSWRWDPESPPALFSQNRRLQSIVLVYLALWTYWAIDPLWRPDWLLENLLVWVGWVAMIVGYRYGYRFSDLSYLLIFLFLGIHGYGGHYSYIETPLGWQMAEWLGSERNPYDRFVHFMSGFLLIYPIAEAFIRWSLMRRRMALAMALSLVLAAGAFYELIEMWVAMIVAPELGHAFLGSQGDVWDPVKDLEAAWWGGLLGIGWVSLMEAFARPGKRRKAA